MTTLAAVPDNSVSISISLGWRLAELFDQDSYALGPGPNSPTPPDHLPGIGQMSAGERAIALTHQVEGAMQSLDLTMDQNNNPQTVREVIASAATPDVIKRQILALYIVIRNELVGSHPDRATALGLGRMLADTCLLPTSRDRKTYSDAFDPYRLQNAYDWLDELSQALPARSAKAVSQSLGVWATWIAKPEFAKRRQNRTLTGHAELAVDVATTRSLRRQGELWRRLLSGEQDPEQLLDSTAYVAAGERMAERLRRLSLRFLRRWWLPCLVFLAVLGGLGFVLIRYAPAGSSRSIAIVVSALAALGVTCRRVLAVSMRSAFAARNGAQLQEALSAIPVVASTPKTRQDPVTAALVAISA